MSIWDYRYAQWAKYAAKYLPFSLIKNNRRDDTESGFFVTVPSGGGWTPIPWTAASISDDFGAIGAVPDVGEWESGVDPSPPVTVPRGTAELMCNRPAWVRCFVHLRWVEVTVAADQQCAARIVHIQSPAGNEKEIGKARQMAAGPTDMQVQSVRWLMCPGDRIRVDAWQTNPRTTSSEIELAYIEIEQVGPDIPAPLHERRTT